VRARCLRASSLPSTNASQMTTLAVTSVSSLLCHASTCFRIGSKFCCIRSTPTEMQSISENDFECYANTGAKGFEAMFPSGPA
jgi:hypothetical protein